MSADLSPIGPEDRRHTWRAVGQALTRPYPVTAPMVLLLCLVPVYLVIARRARVGAAHVPALSLDRSSVRPIQLPKAH